MTGRAGSKLVAVALLILSGACDDARIAFIEPISGSGESRLWSIFARENQAAGPERLGDISGATHRVRYAMFDRWTPFLLTGDLESGAAPVGLQLPRVPDDVSEVTVDVRRTASSWQSFRVYDRGECSLLLPWQSVASAVFGGIMQELEDSKRSEGVAFHWGELTPTLRSEFPGNEAIPPEDHDQLRLRWRWSARHLGTGRVLGCDNLFMTVDMTLEAIPTDLAWYRVDNEFAIWVAEACQDPEITPVAVVVAIGSRNWQTLARQCGELGPAPQSLDGVGPWSMDSVVDARYRLALSGDGSATGILVGLSAVDGQELGAHDTLFRVVEFDISDVSSTDCTNRRRRLTLDSLESQFRNGLVLGLNDGLLQQAQVDPFLVSESDRRCEDDTDCDLESGEPAFAAENGVWRGIRHVCKPRDKPRMRDLARAALEDDPEELNRALAVIDILPQRDICHVQLEPDHLNVRPDGLEGVIAYTRSGDPQGRLLRNETLAGPPLCRPLRAGAGPEEDEPALFVETSTPILVGTDDL
jgi:hypothetical protein